MSMHTQSEVFPSLLEMNRFGIAQRCPNEYRTSIQAIKHFTEFSRF